MLQRYVDLELSMRQQEDQNRELEDQIHRSQRQDTHTQDKLENREHENASLKKALKDLEQRAKVNGCNASLEVKFEVDFQLVKLLSYSH